jgi:hypothetical protein
MRVENLAMATAVAITQTEPNKCSLPALLISISPARTETAQAAETLDLWKTSAHIATSAQGFGWS